MSGSIRLRDGVEIELASGTTVVCDARAPDGDVAVLSHAHGDHLYSDPPDTMVASPLTRDLAALRRPDEPTPAARDLPAIELLDAGHIPGSRAALIEGERTYCYTGDVSTRDRLYMSGFDPPEADVLVVETTYGEADYVFPPVAREQAAFEDWLARNADVPVVVFGYTLGRAQEIQYLLAESDRERVFVSDAIAGVNERIEAATDLGFDVEPWTDEITLGAGDALVLPSGTNRFDWVESLREETGAKTAGLSGWAVDSGYRYANGFDETFVLSDHCDFEELVELVRAVDPEAVYTLHGSAREFARYLTAEEGFQATALERNQTALSEFE
ncbi:MAG: MBL fold metallo-hydrolase RNA specificity domain-containing protein [Haloarculaceae archaeon]